MSGEDSQSLIFTPWQIHLPATRPDHRRDIYVFELYPLSSEKAMFQLAL
jgi:hypothetical protein